MHNIKIEICTDNVAQGTDHVLAKLREEFPEIKIIPYRCVSYCHQCFRVPFVLFNEQLIEASQPDNLYMMLRERLRLERDASQSNEQEF